MKEGIPLKKTICCAICFWCLMLAAVPAAAEPVQWIPEGTELNWPPPASSFEMPTIGYDTNALGIVAESVKISARAIGSKGFWLLMLCTLIGCIPDIFHIFFIDPFEVRRGVRRRVLNRRIKAEDIRQNHAEIVAEKVRDLELANEAQQLFRMMNSEKLLAQRVRQMEFNAEATEIFKRQNADTLSKRRIADMERNFFDRQKFKRDNRVELMMERRFDIKEAESALELHKLEDRSNIFRRRLADMETNDNLKSFYRQAKYDESADIAERMRRMELNDRAKDVYREQSADKIKNRRLREMEISKSIREEFNESHYNESDEIAKQLRHMEENAKAKELFHYRNFDNEVEERIFQRVIAYESEREYNDRYPNLYKERKDQYRQLAKDYYEGNL